MKKDGEKVEDAFGNPKITGENSYEKTKCGDFCRARLRFFDSSANIQQFDFERFDDRNEKKSI